MALNPGAPTSGCMRGWYAHYRPPRHAAGSPHCSLTASAVRSSLGGWRHTPLRHDRFRAVQEPPCTKAAPYTRRTTMTARHRQPPTRGLMRRRSCHEATPCFEEGRIVFEPVWTVIAIHVVPSGLSGGSAWRRSWWCHDQAARCRMTALTGQPFGPGLFAHMAASSLGRVSTYASSLFLALRANSSRRGSL